MRKPTAVVPMPRHLGSSWERWNTAVTRNLVNIPLHWCVEFAQFTLAAYFFLGDGNVVEGVQRLAREAPEGYFGLSVEGQTSLFWVAYLVNVTLGYNVNWHIAQRYYSVPDERDTRKMALWCAVFSLVLPLMWITPVMASRVLFPDLAAMWPELAEPTEAAFVTLAMAILPHGMLGIMVAAIFAATMSSADTTFNWLAAVLTKDVYVPVAKRLGGEPSERRQLFFGKASVAAIGREFRNMVGFLLSLPRSLTETDEWWRCYCRGVMG